MMLAVRGERGFERRSAVNFRHESLPFSYLKLYLTKSEKTSFFLAILNRI